MSIILFTIVSWNYFLSIFSGFIVLTFLILLIIFRTTSTFKPYAKMMLPCAIADFMYLIVDTVGQFKVKLDDGVFLCSLEGPARHLSRNNQVTLTVFYVVGLCLMQTVLPAQAFFRYFAVSRGHTLTALQTTGVFALNVLGILPITFFCYMAFDTSASTRPDFDYSSLWYEGEAPTALLIADIRSSYQKLYFLYSGFVMTGAYAITMYYGSKTIKSLHKQADTFSQRTKRLQSQLSRYLLSQALVPLITAVAPTLCLVISQFVGLNIGGVAALCVLFYSWIPCLNAVITIVVIVPYRKEALRIFLKHQIEPKATTVTSTT